MATQQDNFRVRYGLDVGNKINAATGTTAYASLNIPHGNAPTSPVNGDMWTTTAGIFVHVNGTTVGPLGAGGGGGPTLSDTAPGSPTSGMLWYETDTGIMYVYYDSAWIEVGGAGVGGAIISDTAPASPMAGVFWFKSDTGNMFLYYDSAWVEIGLGIGVGALDAEVVHLAGTETITGAKTFTDSITLSGNVASGKTLAVSNALTNGWSQSYVQGTGYLFMFATNATTGLIQGGYSMPNSSTALISTRPLDVGTEGVHDLRLITSGGAKVTIDSGGVSTFAGPIVAPAATTSIPSIRLPHGTAPSSPTNGDVWTTAAGMYARINGATVGPFAAGGAAVFDAITSSTGAAAAATLWSDVTTGSISIGQGLTTGTLNLATVGTGATPISIGHTNAVITMAGAMSFLPTGVTTVPHWRADADGTIQFRTTGSGSIGINRYSSTSEPSINLLRSLSNTIGTNTTVVSGSGLGSVRFYGFDSAAYGLGAYVQAYAEETWTGSTYASRLGFFVVPTGSTTPTERMRIDNLGAITGSRNVGGATAFLGTHFYGLTAARTLTNGTGAQSIFGVGLTVANSTTYEIEMEVAISSSGTTTAIKQMSFGGTATLTSIGYMVNWVHSATSVATAGNSQQIWVATAAATNLGATGTTNYSRYKVKGLVRVNVSGTFIPQIQWSAAPGAAPSVVINSYVKMTPIGSNTVTTIGTWA